MRHQEPLLVRALSALLVGLSLVCGGAARAALIDQGNITHDTVSHLEWLDLTETLGLSYEDIAAGAGGFLADGWSFATTADVCGLLAHGFAPSPAPASTPPVSPATRTRR